jgi:hypothetical protein
MGKPLNLVNQKRYADNSLLKQKTKGQIFLKKKILVDDDFGLCNDPVSAGRGKPIDRLAKGNRWPAGEAQGE